MEQKSTPAARFGKRVLKEISLLKQRPPPGVQLLESPPEKLLILLKGPEESIYKGESFALQVVCGPKYPMESPEVVFTSLPHMNIGVPIHPHIYSNGHICLDILYAGWSPALTIQSVCLSLLSMIASCQAKVKPDGDLVYCQRVGFRSPKDTKWVFHDDKC
mmetsp:Transcript_18810/g.26397  ORF Transcript_18810/g.26397 Transcript_18810/m.26397 type:complete len:161 (-) Transcript_18810:393-875(-)